jgi:CxxC motif-containing protein (DUF1111 family)
MMRRIVVLVASAYALAGVAAADLGGSSAAIELLLARSGGDATTDDRSGRAFAQPAAGLDAGARRRFARGDRIFRMPWVEAPASVAHFDGLGPFYTRRACAACHAADGRRRTPAGPEDPAAGVVVRLGRPGAAGDRLADPRYGTVLSERAVRGITPEGRLAVTWDEVPHTYPDGSVATLRRPRARLADLAYGPLAADTRFSLRIAPALAGAGLLEAVPESLLVALADAADADGDGISGRVAWLGGGAPAGRRAGRFGWKATQHSVADRVAAALAEDMGITTPSRPEPDVTDAEDAARSLPDGGRPELGGEALQALVDYCRWLAVPARRALDDVAVRRGARRFRDAGCASCHAPALVTGPAGQPALARQRIHPYTDLLLHDMGPGLADGMREGAAAAAEWRTPPLWGLGLAATAQGHRVLLHDGRARSLEEAILWHGGEGARSREAFRALSAAGRRDLVRFLESL